jgi:hypothetical protein
VTAVFYTTEVNDWPAMKLYVDENFPEELKGDLREANSKNIAGYVFEGEGWKWYDSYPDVQAFNRFVSNLLELAHDEEAKLGWNYEFARIGEDYDDVEVNRSDNAAFVLSVNRSIEVEI